MSSPNMSSPGHSSTDALTVPILTNTDPLPRAIIPIDPVYAGLEPQRRPEIYKETLGADQFGIIEKPLTVLERMFNQGWLRKLLLIIALATLWEVYARWLDNELLVPTFSASVQALWQSISDGVLPARVMTSLGVLVRGYATGIGLAAILTILAIGTRIGTDFLELMTAMFNPLPAIALLPLALIWFGLGVGSIVFVIVHSVLWAVALNTHSGFRSVSATHKMVGRNYGLGGLRMVTSILIPAAFPSILTGLKIGWAFAWRTLIAAELVFGVSSGKGGLGWFIFEAKNQLNIPEVFGGLLTIIMIGLFVENVIFRWIEARTIQRWGMQN
jgi:NitT/TauT family transport system permease protein